MHRSHTKGVLHMAAATKQAAQLARRPSGPSRAQIRLQESVDRLRASAKKHSAGKAMLLVETATGVGIGYAEKTGAMAQVKRVTMGVDPTIPLALLSFLPQTSRAKRVLANVGGACAVIAGYKIAAGVPVLSGDSGDDAPSGDDWQSAA